MTVDRLGAPFRRSGITATWTPQNYATGGEGLVLFEAPSLDVLAGVAHSTEYSVVYQATDFADMVYGDTIEIAGVEYTVRGIVAVEDGLVMRATLAKVEP